MFRYSIISGAFVIVSMVSSIALSQDQWNEGQIALIERTSRNVCDTVDVLSGSMSRQQVQGKVDAEVDGLVRSLFNLSGGVGLNISNEEYKGISRDALASALEGQRNCRERVFSKMFDSISSIQKSPSMERDQTGLNNSKDKGDGKDLSLILKGEWRGQYRCGQGVTGTTVTFKNLTEGQVDASFDFYPLPENLGAGEGLIEMKGRIRRDTNIITLECGRFIRNPNNYTCKPLILHLKNDLVTMDGMFCGNKMTLDKIE